VLAAAVALAFADSSIAVLALPSLLFRFDASIGGVSWVITSYNVVVAVAALALPAALRRFGGVRTTAAGLVLFAIASAACGAAWSLPALIAFRCVQGLGGALLLAGSLTLLPSRRLWAAAGAVGAALGPAAGGLLTGALGWRAIFLAQAPVALAALLGVRGPAVELPRERWVLRRDAALALVSAALVGALFLVVVLLVDAWQRSPVAAAAVVTALPLATLAGSRVRGHAAWGALLLAVGLGGLALLPASSLGWVVAALVLAGLGLGLAVPELASGGVSSIGSRHAGLVLGLLLVAPLVAHDLEHAATRAQLGGAAIVLDAPLRLETKVPLAIALANELDAARKGELPDLSRPFRRIEQPRAELDRLERSLDDTVVGALTRSFRRSFALCALLALAACALLVPARPGRRAAVALAAALALLVAELASGAAGYGAVRLRDPCRPRPQLPGAGLDPAAQRLGLRALDFVACRSGESREALVLRVGTRVLDAVHAVERILP
jgi:MFS family permease